MFVLVRHFSQAQTLLRLADFGHASDEKQHECIWLVLPSYRHFLLTISGVPKSELHLRRTSVGTRIPGEEPIRQPLSVSEQTVDSMFMQPLFYLFKLFAVGYILIKPLVRFRIPSIRKELFAATRSALWVWIAGLTG